MKSLIVGGGAVALAVGTASADVVYEDLALTSAYDFFNVETPAGSLLGDGYWCTTGGAAITDLVALELRLSATGSQTPGSTDINFVFADGDPSGKQIFGTGNVLYSTTILGVALPASTGGAAIVELTIPLPNLALNGGFNDWGFSIGVSNFDYAGSMGLWRSLPPTAVGFSSFLGSRYDPVADVWTTFSSGGEVSFAARLVALPSPGGVGLAGVAVLGVLRRRRVA